ncbi:MAG TPA: hypothetical protein PKH07_07505 [bacterium]|nr:hypothetical protein [bacterium]
MSLAAILDKGDIVPFGNIHHGVHVAGIAKGYEALRAVEESVVNGTLQQLTLSHRERSVFVDLLGNLGSGEASCIAIAKERKGIVVADDSAARGVCHQWGCSVTGTIGLLSDLRRERRLSPQQANGLLKEMIQHGFYSPVKKVPY